MGIALTVAADGHYLRVERQHGRGMVIGGIPVGQIAPTVARLRTMGSAMTRRVQDQG
jgi:hypothetical protein